MIDKKKIVKGIGVSILVASLGLGGIALYNGDYKKQELLNTDKAQVVTTNDEKFETETFTTDAKLEYALTYELPDDSPKFIEPEKVDKGEYEALRVPYGYEIYQIEGETAGMFSVKLEDDAILKTAPLGISLDGYVGVSRDVYKLLRAEESFKNSIKTGTAKDDMYLELQKLENENNTTTLRVPNGYDIYYIGDDSSKKTGMMAVNYEKNGEIISGNNVDDYDYKLITASSECNMNEYVGIPTHISEKINVIDSLRQEMEEFYHGLQGKTIS